MQLIKSVASENKTLIMATHDYDITNKFPGRIIQPNNNSIVESFF